MVAKLKEAEAKGATTEEEKAALKKLEADLGHVTNEYLQTAWGLGMAYDQRGWIHMQLRTQEQAEPCYRDALNYLIPVAMQVNQGQLRSQVGGTYYNLACSQACQKKIKEALVSLEESFKWGANTKWARLDGDLRNSGAPPTSRSSSTRSTRASVRRSGARRPRSARRPPPRSPRPTRPSPRVTRRSPKGDSREAEGHLSFRLRALVRAPGESRRGAPPTAPASRPRPPLASS